MNKWTVLSLPAIAETDEEIPIGDGKVHLRHAFFFPRLLDFPAHLLEPHGSALPYVLFHIPRSYMKMQQF